MKRKTNFIPTTGILLSAILLAFGACTSNDWRQFRGPDSDMTAKGTQLPVVWNDSTNIRWTHPMQGESWSSPIIWGDKVFYSSAELLEKSESSEENAMPQEIYRWQLCCLDLKSGEELWTAVSRKGKPRTKKHAGSTYACETPVTDGKYIYVYYGMHGVYCYDMSGALVWEQDPGAYETARGWGSGSSPVLHHQTLYVLVDNEENSFLVAYDATSGAEKWRSARDEKTTYSTPVIWENKERTELVTLGSKARSYDPETGKLLWELGFTKGRAVASPVFDQERIYLGLSGGPRDVGPLFAIKAGASGNITPAAGELTNEFIAWADTLAGLGNPSPLLYEGLVYLLGDRGAEISCFDALTGERIYKEQAGKAGAAWASPWIANKHLFVMDEKGQSYALKTGREFEVFDSNLLDDKFWASVAAAKDAYVFKGVKNIYCVSLN